MIARCRRGLSLVETLSVIVVIAAIAPVLAQLLSSTNAAHIDSASNRRIDSDARFAIETAQARLRSRLEDPQTSIAHATPTSIAFSDGTSLAHSGTAVVWSDPPLPDGVLADAVDGFELRFFDCTGALLDPASPTFDQSEVQRVSIEIDDAGRSHTASVYREGTRDYARAGGDGLLAWGTVDAGAGWTRVELDHTFEDMVVVCTVDRTHNPFSVVPRIRDASGNAFEVRLQSPGNRNPVVVDTVHYIVARRGLYEVNGWRFEAAAYTEARTAENSNWNAVSVRSYQGAYTDPVVIGQVMSSNDARWSVFWCSGNNRSSAPNPNHLRMSKHVGEDNDIVRASEVVGYIVFESATGTLGGVDFEARRTPRVIPEDPTTRSFSRSFLDPGGTVVVASQNGMSGTDGAWAALVGEPGDAHAVFRMEEDDIRDTDNHHVVEFVSYIAFDRAGAIGIGEGN
ncbi:MAG: hypothetical protein Tsb0013_09030 [Phycisphaerales bacterium]